MKVKTPASPMRNQIPDILETGDITMLAEIKRFVKHVYAVVTVI